MALSESIEYDKIEVVGIYKAVQVRKATVIKKNGEELTRSYMRYVLQAGTLDGSDNLIDTDLSSVSSNDDTLASAKAIKAYVDSQASTSEAIQDVVGAMFSSNTETNITATYQDSDGTIDLVSSGSVTETFKTISVTSSRTPLMEVNS